MKAIDYMDFEGRVSDKSKIGDVRKIQEGFILEYDGDEYRVERNQISIEEARSRGIHQYLEGKSGKREEV